MQSTKLKIVQSKWVFHNTTEDSFCKWIPVVVPLRNRRRTREVYTLEACARSVKAASAGNVYLWRKAEINDFHSK